MLPLTEFQKVTDRLLQICRNWYSGSLDDEAFQWELNGYRNVSYQIAEIYCADDEVDWETLPAGLLKQCELASSRHSNAVRLSRAIERSVHELATHPGGGQDPLTRMIVAGKQFTEWQVDEALLVDIAEFSGPDSPGIQRAPSP
ncbi:hypothetical protein GYB59_01380 [bacterium]|nr:hypothetical protein [bacterium]